MSDTYEADGFYLHLLLLQQRVLQSGLKDTGFFQDTDKTLMQLKCVQSEIDYLKQTQPELFL